MEQNQNTQPDQVKIKCWYPCREPVGGLCTDTRDDGTAFHRPDHCSVIVTPIVQPWPDLSWLTPGEREVKRSQK
jgi:hypothetical protein